MGPQYEMALRDMAEEAASNGGRQFRAVSETGQGDGMMSILLQVRVIEGVPGADHD